MAVEPRALLTREEYLALERVGDQNHEYIAGEVRAMAGGSPQHSEIAASTISALVSQLRPRPCKVYTGDLRVAIRAANVYTYPDVTVVCGEPQFDGDGDGLLNPTLIVEVHAPATAVYDSVRKFQRYRQLPSLELRRNKTNSALGRSIQQVATPMPVWPAPMG
jgi:Uma2 family endonuclease